MKKMLLLTIVLSIILTGCKDPDITPIQCEANQIEENGVCVDIIDPIECEEGQQLIDDECVNIVVKSDLEKAFESSIDMKNYEMTIQITEGDTTVTMLLKQDVSKSSITLGDRTEFFKQEDGVCYLITEQLDAVIQEEIDCISSDDTRYQFFHVFEIDWFEEIEEGYSLKEAYYAPVINFFRNSLRTAEISNFVLHINNDYFSSFTFQVIEDDTVYDFIISFENIGTTEVVLP